MIAETGHYALILALGVAIVQMLVPLIGTHYRDPKLTAVAVPAAQAEFILIGIAFIALDDGLRDVGLLGRQCLAELPLGEAAALQNLRRVGEP